MKIPSGASAISAFFSRARSISAIGARPAPPALERVAADLADLRSLAASRAGHADPAVADARARVEGIARAVHAAADRPTRPAPPGETPIDYAPAAGRLGGVDIHSDRIEQARGLVFHPLSAHVDIHVDILASAQHGGFYLSFGGHAINLSSPFAQFRIELGGNTGVRTFAFASGATLRDIASAINADADLTGVTASLSGAATGTGILLRSDAIGENHFVSVRVADDGGINAAQAHAGVYRLRADDEHAADLDGATPFSAASILSRDFGQDVVAIVNGVEAESTGRDVRVGVTGNPHYYTEFRLTLAGAQRRGAFRAFTIHPRAPAGTPTPAHPTPASTDEASHAAFEVRATLLHQRRAP